MTEKLDMTTPDMVTQNIERIAALFPNCVTEVSAVSGSATPSGAPTTTRKIDFDLLRQELSRDIVEGPKERYRLEWPGKREAIVTANMPTTNTLRPVREDSVNFDTTENLYIEGDNLEVLKLLQESYLGKIKMIDIDPPYNTGHDFVYKDNFTKDIDTFKDESGFVNEYNERLVENADTSGRYHSDWLTMMYPRLKLARNLLSDNGVIFIHIDEHEVHNLRKMCDEIFGEMNFVTEFVWQKRVTRENRSLISVNHEYVVCYAKGFDSFENAIHLLPMDDEAKSRYKNPDNDPRGVWTSVPAIAQAGHGTKNQFYSFNTPSGREVSPPSGSCWRYTNDKMMLEINNNNIWFGSDGTGVPRIKKFITDGKQGLTPNSIIQGKEIGTTDSAKRELTNLFEGNSVFETPKPSSLLKHLLNIGTDIEDVVLDFFSGTSPLADAVMQLNSEDKGNRKFIMVQIPEATAEDSEAYKAGYKNICEIGKERIRRAGAKIVETSHTESQKAQEKGASLFDGVSEGATPSGTLTKTDVGFRVYRLDTSNMQDVYYRPQDYKQEMMDELFANHIKDDRTPDDLVAQVMLDWGLPLSLPIEKTEIAGKTVYKVDGNALYCCFAEGIDEGFVRSLVSGGATWSGTPTTALPLRIVFHDHSFASDTAKENVRQLLKQLSSDTEMKVI